MGIVLAACLLLQNAEEYMPVKTGSILRFEESGRKDIGKVSNLVIALAAIKQESVKGNDCVLLETTGEAAFMFSKMWITCDKDGVKIHKMTRAGTDYVLDTPQLLLKSPLKKGAKWTGETPGGKYECTCESDDETHEVYLGKFPKVKRVSMKIGDITATAWFAKGIGPIRFKYVWESKQTNERLTREVDMNDCDGVEGVEFEFECPKCKKTAAKPGECPTCKLSLNKVPKSKAMKDNLAGKDVMDKITKYSPSNRVKYDFSDGGKRGKVTTLREALGMLLGAAKVPWEIGPGVNADEHLLDGKGECDTVKECLEDKVLKPLGLKWELRGGKVYVLK